MTISIEAASFEFFDDQGDLILTVKVEDAGAGKFFAITTERWTFDKPEDLLAVIQRVRSKFSDEEWAT
jgi:hypothetical protein